MKGFIPFLSTIEVDSASKGRVQKSQLVWALDIGAAVPEPKSKPKLTIVKGSEI